MISQSLQEFIPLILPSGRICTLLSWTAALTLLPCNLVISVSVALYFTLSHVSSQLPILARTTETFILKTLTFLV